MALEIIKPDKVRTWQDEQKLVFGTELDQEEIKIVAKPSMDCWNSLTIKAKCERKNKLEKYLGLPKDSIVFAESYMEE